LATAGSCAPRGRLSDTQSFIACGGNLCKART
jgi:hypothetical protein